MAIQEMKAISCSDENIGMTKKSFLKLGNV